MKLRRCLKIYTRGGAALTATAEEEAEAMANPPGRRVPERVGQGRPDAAAAHDHEMHGRDATPWEHHLPGTPGPMLAR